jgi:hypothetical protein
MGLLNADSYRAPYDASISGLANLDNCESADEGTYIRFNGFLFSIKGLAEHNLPDGDSQTDLNQANALLVKCQTMPGLYGTHNGASCESQEQTNTVIHHQNFGER